MTLDLFAGIQVSDFAASRDWYERLLGAPPSFFPHETECVWELAEHRFLYINRDPSRAGGGSATMLVPDLDAVVAAISSRGIEPADRETYDNGTTKVTYRDPDGSEIGYAAVPAGA